MSLPARIVGVIMSPRQTYTAVAAHPRFLGVLLVTIAITAGVTFWFQSTEAGQKAYVEAAEAQLRALQNAGIQIPDESFANLESGAANAAYQSAGAIVIATPIMYVILAGILLGIFNGMFGGNARFKQVFAVVVHAGVIWTLAAAFSALMGFTTGRVTGASSLGVFFPMLDEMSFITYFLRAIDVFYVWGFFNLAIGLAVLYRRRTGPVAITFIGLYVIVAVLIAAVRSAF